MIQFIKRHTILSLAFFVVLAITLFFAFRLTVSTVIWINPDRVDQAIAGWMTPRYVAKSWQLPPEMVASALDLDFDGAGRRMTLAELAELQGRDIEFLIDDLEIAIDTFRATSND